MGFGRCVKILMRVGSLLVKLGACDFSEGHASCIGIIIALMEAQHISPGGVFLFLSLNYAHKISKSRLYLRVLSGL